MRRRLDPLHPPALRQVARSDVRPRAAVVARDVERTVVRARPDHARLVRRFRDRVQRAVKLLARHVARDRLAARALAARRVACQIRTDRLPRHAQVARAVHVLRAVVQHLRIVRRRRHR